MAGRKKLSDLAHHLGISEATVSLALNGREGVSPVTKKKVLQAAKELGYTPNYFARGLATRKSGIIGLIVPEIENPFYSRLTQAMDQAVRRTGHHLIIEFSNFDLESERQAIKRFLQLSAEGIVISPIHCYATSEEYRQLALQKDVPIMYIGAHYDFDSHYVMTDLSMGSEQLTTHLLSQGIRDIVFLTGPRDILLASTREAGFEKAYAQFGIEVSENRYVRCNKFNYEEAYRLTTELLKGKTLPQAIITVNDIMALGVMRAIRQLGYRIPDDIRIAGYDNVIYSEIAEVSLTTVYQPVDVLVETTVKHLLQLIDEPNSESWIQLKVEPELIIRESTQRRE